MAGVEVKMLRSRCAGPIPPGHLTPIAEAHADEAVVSPLSTEGGAVMTSPHPILRPGLHLHSTASLRHVFFLPPNLLLPLLLLTDPATLT